MEEVVIDLAYLERFSKGDRSRMAKYIGLYLDGAPALFARLSDCQARGDAEGLGIAAHSLRTQVNLMGAGRLHELLTAIERDTGTLGAAGCESAVREALMVNDRVMASLRDWTGGTS